MSKHRFLATALSTLGLAPLAAGQSAFHPMPRIPFFAEPARASVPPPPVFAELEELDRLPAQEDFVDFRFHGFYDPGSDFEGAAGELGTTRGGWRATLGRRRGGREIFAVELDTEASFYDFSGAAGLVPASADPFNDLYRASLSIRAESEQTERASVFSGFVAELGGEDEASPLDALAVGGAGGVRYRASDDFALALGIAAQSRLEDTAWIWPFVGFEWQASERVRLEAFGPRLDLELALSERWTGLAQVAYEMRQYRLNEEGPLPEGVFRDEEIRFAAGARYQTGGGISLQLLGGVHLWRELSTFDDGGHQLGEVELEPSPFLAFGVSGSF